MATYCFRCETCGATFTSPVHQSIGICSNGHIARRDYRAEAVGVQVVQLKRERERGGSTAVRDTFLPTAKDFEGPNDPDGTKGITQWAEEHGPKPGNKRPLYPDLPKKVF